MTVRRSLLAARCSLLAARCSPTAADCCRRSAGCEHGFGERRAKRRRHSHRLRAELRHGWPNADGLFGCGGAVRQHIVDVVDDGRMHAASVRRHCRTADSGESECGGGHCAWSVQLRRCMRVRSCSRRNRKCAAAHWLISSSHRLLCGCGSAVREHAQPVERRRYRRRDHHDRRPGLRRVGRHGECVPRRG